MKRDLKYTVFRASMTILLISILLWTFPAWAGEGENTASISPINPPVEFQPFHAVDPESIQRGTLNAIDKEGVMIDGTYKRFSKSVSFLSYEGKPMGKSRFVPGMPVGFRVNPVGEVIGLWDLRPEMLLIP